MTSMVALSRTCNASEAVGLGSTVAACGLTVSGFGGSTVLLADDESCERAFLLVGLAAGGKSAVQMSWDGGTVSLEGMVKRGVSQRENGLGGS